MYDPEGGIVTCALHGLGRSQEINPSHDSEILESVHANGKKVAGKWIDVRG